MSTELANLFVSLTADVSSFTNSFHTSMVSAELVADAIKEVARAAVDFAKDSLMMAGQLEQSQTAFSTMLGSAEKAQAFLKDLAQFAANTPFEFIGLQDAARKLIAFGFDARDIIPIMRAVGDAVAGLGGGAAEVDRVARALGQIQAKGKASAEEMLQLAEMGIPAWDILAKKIGVSIPQAMDMAKKGAIDSSTAITALVEGMGERFGGMMDAQSKQFLGVLSNLQDGVNMASTQIGKSLIEGLNLTPIIANVAQAVGELASMLESSGLGGTFDKIFGPEMKAAILGISVAIYASLIPGILAAAEAFAAAVIAAGPFLAVAAAVAIAAYPIIKNWDELGQFFQTLWRDIQVGAEWLYGVFGEVFSKVAEVAGKAVKAIRDKLAPIFNLMPKEAQVAFAAFGESLMNVPKLAIKPWQMLGSAAQTHIGGMITDVGAFITKMTTMPKSISDSAGKVQLHLKSVGAAANGAAAEAEKAAKKAAEAAKKLAEEIAGIFADLPTKLQNVAVKAKVFGETMDINAKQASVLRSEIEKLIDKGVSPADKQVQKLIAQWRKYNSAAEDAKAAQVDLSKATVTVGSVLEDVWTDLDKASKKAALLGKDFDLAGEQSRVLNEGLKKVADVGGPGAKEAIEQLRQSLALAKPAQDGLTASVNGFKQSTTDVLTSVNGLKDGLKTIGETLGLDLNNGFLDGAVKAGGFGLALVQVGTSVQALIPAVTTQLLPAMMSLGTAIMAGIPGLVTMATTVWTSVVPAFTAWATATIAATWPILAIIAAVTAVGVALVALYQNVQWFRDGVNAAWAAVSEGATAAFAGMAGVVASAWDAVTSHIKGQINFISSAINFLIRGMNSIRIQVPKWVPGIGGMGWGGPGIPEIPMLAKGGLVTGPTMAVVGEGTSPEAVLPLNRAVFDQVGEGIARSGGGGSGGTQVIINISVDDTKVGERLVRELRRYGIRP